MLSTDRGIAIVIIIATIIIFISIIILVIFYYNRSNSDQLQPQPQQSTIDYIPPIWGNNILIGVCTGYRFPPIDSTTPSVIHSNSSIEGLTPYNGGFNCTWNDEINRQLIQRTCLQGTCVDDQGNVYNVGETNVFSGICGGTGGRCIGDLGLIAIGTNSGSYSCITSNPDNSVGSATCNLFDYNQYLIFNYSNDYLTQIIARDYDYALTAVDNRAVFLPTSTVSNGGIQWITIPPMIISTTGSSSRMIAPPQIGYVGDLPIDIINNPTNYRDLTSLRNLIIKYGISTLQRNSDNEIVLADWLLVLPGTIPDNDYYSSQASSFISIYRMDQIGDVLSQP